LKVPKSAFDKFTVLKTASNKFQRIQHLTGNVQVFEFLVGYGVLRESVLGVPFCLR
jgi:hypothetical protein